MTSCIDHGIFFRYNRAQTIEEPRGIGLATKANQVPVLKETMRAFEHFAIDTFYSSLQFKCVNKAEQKYAIRINKKGYRALGYLRGDDMLWEWIGPHDEYERRIRQ